MANIQRWDPFADSPFDELFKGFLLPVRWGKGATQLRMDVSEDDKNYMVKADLPGVKREDIHVAIDGNQVSITAESKEEKEEKKADSVCQERHYGKIARSFTLAHDIDSTKADAKFADGVLKLTLPKKAEVTSAKQISVH